MKKSAISSFTLLGLGYALPEPAVAPVAARLTRALKQRQSAPYGKFPVQDDPFQFIPCTDKTLPPRLEDEDAAQSWKALFNPDPNQWMWGDVGNGTDEDPFRGRGIYLCGYLDVPYDYNNKSEPRIFRLAVGKYQASGLALAGSNPSDADRKSERTLVINPGGPGGSGMQYVTIAGEELSGRISGGVIDVLSWDPRGINATQPAFNCYPHDAYADRWQYANSLWPEIKPGTASDTQYAYADALADATMQACAAMHGDLGRFIGTTLVARDMEEIRKAIDEPELTAYLLSYGTELGQTYSNMFPDKVGRIILDGPTYSPEIRLATSFITPAIEHMPAAWLDGFLGECIKAGPLFCQLATPLSNASITVADLDRRIRNLVGSLAENPMPAFSISTGPSLITFKELASSITVFMYQPSFWPQLAAIIWRLEQDDWSLVQTANGFRYSPEAPPLNPATPLTVEITYAVICADNYDDDEERPDQWWKDLRTNLTAISWFAGDLRSQQLMYCRHFRRRFGPPVELFRGDLTEKLKNPMLMIAQTHDPATPLVNGQKLLARMGQENIRLVVHHGYGHGTHADKSSCSEALMKAYILDGKIPDEAETDCYADTKPFTHMIPFIPPVGDNSTSTEKRSASNLEGPKAFRQMKPTTWL